MGKRFLHNRAAVVTVAFVLLIALIGILAPLLAPHDPYVTDILDKFAPYSLEYPLGTDHLGRCVLSRLIYGIRPTLGLALLTMLGTIALGALLGVMAGYFRGVVEEIIMRVVDVMLSFPVRSWCSPWWAFWGSMSKMSSLPMCSSNGPGMPV